MRATRWALPAALILLVPSAATVGTAAPAAAAVPCLDSGSPTDLDGDGWPDQVAADPYATVAGARNAGRVHVRYGAAGGRTARARSFAQGDAVVGGAAEAGDGFGRTLRVGLVDDDRCGDVVVGVPGENLSGAVDAGLVQVIFGAPGGLGRGRPTLTLSAGTGGLGAGPRAGERFGAALATTDRLDPEAEPRRLAIGVPGRTVSGARGAGAVAVVTLDGAGGPVSAETVTQSTPGVPGASTAGDSFGSALEYEDLAFGCGKQECTDLAVGVPGKARGAGAVTILTDREAGQGWAGQYLSQATSGIEGASEPGDRFGSALAADIVGGSMTPWLAVGIPGEDLGPARDAGAVQVMEFTSRRIGNRQLSQQTARVGGTAGAGDRFGSSVWIGTTLGQVQDFVVAVGVPGEDVGRLRDAGAVQVIPLNEGTKPIGTRDRLVTQDSAGVPGAAAAGERFGAALSGDFDAAVIGVPDDRGWPRGAVLRVPWATMLGALYAGSAWTPSAGYRFGSAIGA